MSTTTGSRFRTLLAMGSLVVLLAACAGASPSASSSPTPPPVSETVVGAFFDMVKAPGFSAETELSGTVTSAGVRLSLEAVGSLSGNDGQMAVTLSEGQASVSFDVIFTGDFGYVRQAGGDWQQVDRDAVNTSGAQLDSFEFITEPSDLRYDGTATYRGETVRDLVNAGAISVPGASAQDPPGKVGLLHVYVRDDGTPLFMSYRVEANAVDTGGSKIRAVGDIEQTFTNVGTPVTVSPPPGF
jgi:hypothetical protein